MQITESTKCYTDVTIPLPHFYQWLRVNHTSLEHSTIANRPKTPSRDAVYLRSHALPFWPPIRYRIFKFRLPNAWLLITAMSWQGSWPCTLLKRGWEYPQESFSAAVPDGTSVQKDPTISSSTMGLKALCIQRCNISSRILIGLNTENNIMTKSSIFWDITLRSLLSQPTFQRKRSPPSSGSNNKRRKKHVAILPTDWLGSFSADYMALYPWRQKSSWPPLWEPQILQRCHEFSSCHHIQDLIRNPHCQFLLRCQFKNLRHFYAVLYPDIEPR
jgi:hypothetical protein